MCAKFGRWAALALLGCAAAASAWDPPPTGWNPPALVRAEFSRDGKLILGHFYQTTRSGLGDNLLPSYLLDAATGAKLADVPVDGYPHGGDRSHLHPDGKHLVLIRPAPAEGEPRRQQVVLWDWKAGKEARAFTPSTAHVGSFAFTPDGRSLLTGHWDHRILRWDVKAGKEAKEYDLPRMRSLSTAHYPTFHFTADGRRVVTGYAWRLEAIDVETGKEVWPRPPGYEKAQDVSHHHLLAVTSDGRLACTGLMGTTRANPRLRLWDLRAGKVTRALNLPRDNVSYVSAAAFVDRDRTLLVLDESGWLHTWDVASGAREGKVRVLKKAPVQTAAFSADGRFLLTNGEGAAVQLWDVARQRVRWAVSFRGD